jgi:hypothetical protein
MSLLMIFFSIPTVPANLAGARTLTPKSAKTIKTA